MIRNKQLCLAFRACRSSLSGHNTWLEQITTKNRDVQLFMQSAVMLFYRSNFPVIHTKHTSFSILRPRNSNNSYACTILYTVSTVSDILSCQVLVHSLKPLE
jgi:hypothetical protein